MSFTPRPFKLASTTPTTPTTPKTNTTSKTPKTSKTTKPSTSSTFSTSSTATKDNRSKDDRPKDIRSEVSRPKEDTRPKDIHSKDSRPSEIRPKETRSNEIRPNKIRPNEIRPNKIRPNEIRSNEIRPKDIRSQEIRPQDHLLKDIRPNRLDAPLTHNFLQSLPINYDRRCVSKFLMDVDKFQEVLETQQDELDTDVFPKVYDVLRSDPTLTNKTIDSLTRSMVTTYGVYVENLAIAKMTLGEQGTDRRDCANLLRHHKDELIHRYKSICKTRAISLHNYPQLKQVFLEYEQDSYALIRKDCEDMRQMAEKAFKNSNVRVLNISFESVTFSIKLGNNDLTTSIML